MWNRTALHIAVMSGHEAVVDVLLKSGAEVPSLLSLRRFFSSFLDLM